MQRTFAVGQQHDIGGTPQVVLADRKPEPLETTGRRRRRRQTVVTRSVGFGAAFRLRARRFRRVVLRATATLIAELSATVMTLLVTAVVLLVTVLVLPVTRVRLGPAASARRRCRRTAGLVRGRARLGATVLLAIVVLDLADALYAMVGRGLPQTRIRLGFLGYRILRQRIPVCVFIQLFSNVLWAVMDLVFFYH